MKQDNTLLSGDSLLQQITNISKAHAYDIVSQQAQDLIEENVKLKARVKHLEDLVREYAFKMKANLSGGKVDQFLKEQITKPESIDDIPNDGLFQKPGIEDLENTIN